MTRAILLVAFLMEPAGLASSRPVPHDVNNGHIVTVAGTLPQATRNPEAIRLPIVDGTDIRFARLSTSEELLHTNVYRIIQDDQGFMWFATAYGLYRYDG